ncbi:MAG: hypothetical protein MI924_26855 [Chloroflexales bacterium]|nr:hypothetical protein [Chloroflexales bacterium]
MNDLKSKNWIAASWNQVNPGKQVILGIESVAFKAQSALQEVIVANVPVFGRGLFLDGNVQLLQMDEYIYHEHVAVVPLLFHPAPRRALILGGGDGLVLREVLRDSRVEHVTLVDIDALVLQACRTHLGALHRGSFDDPRANIVVDDARQFLAAKHSPFDIVIVDLVDPYGEEGRALYREVIGLVKGVLAPGAIVSSHGSSADPPGYVVLEVYALLRQYFAHLALHRAYIPSFAEEWGFLLASDAVDFEQVTSTDLQERARRLSGPLRSIIPEQYPLAFRLPPALAEAQRQRQARPPDEVAADEPEFRWIYQDG